MSLGMTVITNDNLQSIIDNQNNKSPLDTIDDNSLIYTNFSGKIHRFTDIIVASAIDKDDLRHKQFIEDTGYDNCYQLSVATLLQAIKASTDKATRIKWDDYVDLLENLNPDSFLKCNIR